MAYFPSFYLLSYCTAFLSLFSEQTENGINSRVSLAPLAIFGGKNYKEKFKLIYKTWFHTIYGFQ